MPTDAAGFLAAWAVHGLGSPHGRVLADLVPILTLVGGMRIFALIIRRSVEGR